MVPPAPPSTTTSSTEILNKSCFIHTPCYCEENVYFLCKKLSELGLAHPEGHDLFVVFVSNEGKQVPLWWQKASKIEDGLVIWDYHVFCIQMTSYPIKSRNNVEGNSNHLVWDLDSSLPFPLPLNQYIDEAIKPSEQLLNKFRRLFRVIHAPKLIQHFASDRSHMRDSLGNWISPPPSYNPIVAEDGSTNNLNDYIQVRKTNATRNLDDLVDEVFSKDLGVVVGEEQLEDIFFHIQNRL